MAIAFQEDAFQVTGFAFQEDSGAAPSPSPYPPPAGGSRRRRRQYVEIDGQFFDVENAEHARALLDQAKAIALKNAEKLVEPQVKRGLVSPPRNKPIRVDSPIISTSINELQSLVMKMQAEIKAIYRKAALDAEIRLRMEMIKRDQDDESDDEFLLLL